MSLISVTDMVLLNNQGYYLDKCWLVHLNQAHCAVQSLTRPWLCWKPPSRRLSKVTADSFLWQPLARWRHRCEGWSQREVSVQDGYISPLMVAATHLNEREREAESEEAAVILTRSSQTYVGYAAAPTQTRMHLHRPFSYLFVWLQRHSCGDNLFVYFIYQSITF